MENTVIKKKILVVEDEETLLQLQTILLTVKGYEVEGGNGWPGGTGGCGSYEA